MGVQIGLRDVYYALLNSDTVGVGVSYAAPVQIVGAITANINPNSSSETLFADDGPYESATALGEISLELNMADIPLAIQAVLLGHTAPVAGVMGRGGGDIPPFVALGFRSLKSNGNYRYVWLLKGRFMVPEQNHNTKGESITFQTPTITGAFVRRDFDDLWQLLGDEDEGYAGGTAGWFSIVRIDA